VSDDELRLVKMRKMLELQRKLLERKMKSETTVPDYTKIFLDNLTSDGLEMYRKAEEQYPIIARRVAYVVGGLYAIGRIRGKLDARAVYGIFAEIGYPIRLDTKIVYKKKGKVKSISELIRGED